MRRTLFCLTLTGLILLVSENAEAQNCNPRVDQVAVFTEPLYKGTCTVLDQGNHPNVSQSILKNVFRSIIVGRAVKAQVCNRQGLKGSCETFVRSGDLILNNSGGRSGSGGVSLRVTRLSNARNPVRPSRKTGVVVFDNKTGYILGGYQDRRIVNDKIASTFFRTGDSFRFYGLKQGDRSSAGSANYMIFADRCEVYPIDFKGGKGSIALSSNATWNPLPRTPRILKPNDRTYSRITREFLESKGISNPVINNTQIIRVDLEGDGVDEVILTGRHVKSENADKGQTFKKGSYSFILVRKIIAGKVESIAIGTEIYSEDITVQQWRPREREVTAIMDLDADGVMEIVVHTAGYEGDGTTVYKIQDGKAVSVLDVGCGA